MIPEIKTNYDALMSKKKYDALVTALWLAVTAPDDDMSQECADIAKSIAVNLSETEFLRAQKEAESLIEKSLKWVE